MYKGRKQKKEDSRARGLLISLSVSVGAVLAFGALMSAIAAASSDPTGKIGIYALISLIASAAVSGFTVSRISGGNVGSVAFSSFCTVLILILAGAIISGGALGLSALMNYISYFGVSILFSLLGKRRERRHRRR